MSRHRDANAHERTRREHQELRRRLRAVHRALADPATTVAQLAGHIESLERQLRGHFAEEVRGGFFDGIVAQAPQLAARTERLRREHDLLLAAAGQLAALAREAPGGQWRELLEAQFHAFSRQLMQHESTENELVQAAYGQDVGAPD
jgi:iron-sulfur cluster repair protein YtfE (RIC family)